MKMSALLSINSGDLNLVNFFDAKFLFVTLT